MRTLRKMGSACINSAPLAILQLSYNGQHKYRAGFILALVFSLYGCGHKGPLIAPEANSDSAVSASDTQPGVLQLPETHSH